MIPIWFKTMINIFIERPQTAEVTNCAYSLNTVGFFSDAVDQTVRFIINSVHFY